MNEHQEQALREVEDILLIGELRRRLETVSDSNAQKLGILLLNLGADAQREMVSRNIRGAVPTAQEPEYVPMTEEERAHYEDFPPEEGEDQTHDDGTVGYDYHGDRWAAREALEDHAAMQEDAWLEAQYEDRVSGGYED